MSTAKQYFAGTGKAQAEKSNFAQTCNRLSLFLKEKGNLRDLHIGIDGKLDDIGRAEKSATTAMTFDLLSNMENLSHNTAQTEESMNFLPQFASLHSYAKPEDSTNKAASSSPVPALESKTAQMTIFYEGQVVVFDDIPADRARDVILAAGSCPPSTGKEEAPAELSSTSNHPSDVCRPNEPIHAQLEANGLDLPIARRASLHKFLAKRKDRSTVRAPYQLHNPSPAAAPSKNEHKFDLNA